MHVLLHIPLGNRASPGWTKGKRPMDLIYREKVRQLKMSILVICCCITISNSPAENKTRFTVAVGRKLGLIQLILCFTISHEVEITGLAMVGGLI